MRESTIDGRAWAVLLTRVILGLTFFMAGWWKVFQLGAAEYARQWVVEPYADTWIPSFLLWTLGAVIPFLELVAGGLLILGWRTRISLHVLGCILVLMTTIHLLKEPLDHLTDPVLPRLAMLVFLLWTTEGSDPLSLGALLDKHRRREGP